MPAHLAVSPRRGAHRGLTLIELMVGIAVLAVVMAVATPSYKQFGRTTRVLTQASELQNAMAYARSESLRRGVRVSVCRSADPQAASPVCSGSGDWASGWIVFTDSGTTGTIDGSDVVLRAGNPATNSAVTAAGNLDAWVAFSPQGLALTKGGTGNAPASGSFGICQAPNGRRVAVSPVGVITNIAEACT